MTNLGNDMAKQKCRGIWVEANGITVQFCETHGYAHAIGWQPISYGSGFWESKPGELLHLREQARWWRKVHLAWLDHARRWLDGKDEPWLLDCGAGIGLFIDAASGRGLVATGIEPSTMAVAAAGPSTHLVRGHYRDAAIWEGLPWKYNLISAHWLLEHLAEPTDFLAWCNEHLEKEGLLMLAVPNEWSALQKAANRRTRRPYWWLDATHFSYWGHENLERLLAKQGWRVVSRMGTFPMELFILLGLDYVDRPRLGRALHRIVETVELFLPLPVLRIWYSWLGRMGIGRDQVVFCKRILDV